MKNMTIANVENLSKSERSPFAEALRHLLDDTDLQTRSVWAEVLDVTESAISQWVNDQTLPRAGVLRAITDMVGQYSPITPWLASFKEMAKQPSDFVSPYGHRMRPTVGAYLVGPVWDGFKRIFRTLEPHQQEEVLDKASRHCWCLKEQAQSPKPTRSRELVVDMDPEAMPSILRKAA